MNNQIKNDKWKDEAGIEIPAGRITKSEKLRERLLAGVAKDAKKLSAQLTAAKQTMGEVCEELVAAIRADNDVAKKETKDTKGNLTLYNFDRSIRFERRINEQIAFDDVLIGLCKEKLDEFLNRAIHGSENADLVRELVKDAFENTKGSLDAKKVMGLLKHENKIESSLYKEAMKLLRDSIRRPGSKTYYAVSVKKENGGYELINLNISSI